MDDRPSLIPFDPQVRIAEPLADLLAEVADLLKVEPGRLVSRQARVTAHGGIMLLELRPYEGALDVEELVVVYAADENVNIRRFTDGNLATNRYADLEENL